MRRKFRAILSLFFALVCTVCLAAALTACNPHEHTWSESWTTDSDYHWHAPKCDDTDEVKDKAAHVDANQDGKCDVCSYDVGHEHTFADDWTSDETHHWHEATCSHTNEKGSYAEHEDIDEDGECDTCHKAVEHKHRYAKEWSTDKNNHWHDAICSHQTEKSEFGAHVDENQNGYCDVCDYEIGHEHSYEEGWTTSETQHWHAATCTHQNMKSELGNHEFDADGNCSTCHYHRHVFSEAWTVDQNKHWHAATCEDGGDEKSNEEAHDFGFSGKCKCGVEQLEINIYNAYYKPAQEFANEEVKDFGAWHAELVEAGVKHIELDVLTQDVVYTYDNPEGEDIKEVKYGVVRTIKLNINRGALLEKDERGLPDVTFKVIAKIDGEPVLNGKALGTGKINRTSGAGEITFTPYFGYSGTNHAGQKIEYAVTLAVEGDKDYVEVINAYVFTSATELTFTVSGNTHEETFTGNFDMERSLGTGEAGKLDIDFGESSDLYVTKTLRLNVPAGWYMVGIDLNSYSSIVVTVDGNSDQYSLSNGVHSTGSTNSKRGEGAIYVPEGAKTIKFQREGSAAKTGTASLEPINFDNIKTDGTVNYLPISFRHPDMPDVKTARIYYKLPAGTYEFAITSFTSNTEALSLYVNDTSVASSSSTKLTTKLILKEDDKFNIEWERHSNSTPYTSMSSVKINRISDVELNKDFTFSFSTSHKSETRLFKAEKDGLYAITLTSESDLRNVSVGYGATSTSILVGTASAERKTVEAYIYMKAGATQYINIDFTGSSGYAENITCKVTEAQFTAFTAGESASITINNTNPIYYRSFTAEKDGYYTFSASSTSNIRYFTVGMDGATDDLISSYTATRYAASNVFYAKKGVPVIFTLTRSTTATFTVNCLINAVEFASAELNKATEFNFSKDKITAAYSFTATEAGKYMLTINHSTSATTDPGQIRVLRSGEEGFETLSISTSSTYYRRVTLTLEKDEKVELLFLYDSTSTSYPKLRFTINHSEPTALTADKEEKVELSQDYYTRTYKFTATEAGSYMLILSASNLNYVDVLNGEGGRIWGNSTRNLTFINVFIALDKDEELTLVFEYNYPLLKALEIKLTLNKIVSEDLTANKTQDVTLGNGKAIKSFSFTAIDEAYYGIVLSSETSLSGVQIINGETGANIVTKITSSTIKISITNYKLTASQKINFLIVYDGSSEVSLKFRVEYDTPTALTANKDVEITFSAENNVEYYSFTVEKAGAYAVVLTSETDLKNVQVYNAATNSSVGLISTTSKYYVTTSTLATAGKVNFLVKYNSNENYPKVNFRVEYDTPAEMTVNEDKTIEFSKDNLAEYYTFTATEAGTYMRVLTTETDLKNLQIVNAETGASILTKVASTKKSDLTRVTMTVGQKISFLIYYNITEAPETFPTINFRMEYRNATELTVNTDTEVKFTEEQNVVYLSFTATDANYYTLVLNAEENISNVKIENAKTSANYGTVTDAKFLSYNKLKLTAEEKITFLIYFDGSENYPTFKFRVEYDTPKALTVNTTQKITFSATNNAEYYSFTASEAAVYALVLTSETSLNNVSVVNLANSNDLFAITTEDKGKVYISTTTKLTTSNPLNFEVLYKGNENHPVVNLTMVYNKPTEMTANTDTSVTFAAGKNVEYLSFTAAEAGQYALQLTSDTSLKNIQVYNEDTGASIIDNIAETKAKVLVSSVTKFTQGGKLVMAVAYNGAGSYPTVKVNMIKEQETTALNFGANTVTFAVGTHVKTVSYLSAEAASVMFGFSAESGLTDVKVYNGTTGAALTLTDGKTATQEIKVNTPFVMIITYTGSTELNLTVTVMGLLSAPANLKLEGYTLLTWDAVPNATKYKVTWKGGTGETTKTYYNIPSFSLTMTPPDYTVTAVDETGKYGDSGAAKVTGKDLWYYLTNKIIVTVKVPEGFPATLSLLKLQTSKASNASTFVSNMVAAAIVEVTGQGEYTCNVPLAGASGNDKVYLRIDPSTLPEGYTCQMTGQISGGKDVEQLLEITKA